MPGSDLPCSGPAPSLRSPEAPWMQSMRFFSAPFQCLRGEVQLVQGLLAGAYAEHEGSACQITVDEVCDIGLGDLLHVCREVQVVVERCHAPPAGGCADGEVEGVVLLEDAP